MDKADVAFLGINPGGSRELPDRDGFSSECGSAYVVESWRDREPGQSPLQKQIQSLFRKLNVDPNDVLAGNLIPFRSPRYKTLPNKGRAEEFGSSLWATILSWAKPKLVIGMGGPTNNALMQMLEVHQDEPIPVNWGKVKACRGTFNLNGYAGTFVGLPHLSTFKIMNRPESQAPLGKLLSGQHRA